MEPIDESHLIDDNMQHEVWEELAAELLTDTPMPDNISAMNLKIKWKLDQLRHGVGVVPTNDIAPCGVDELMDLGADANQAQLWIDKCQKYLHDVEDLSESRVQLMRQFVLKA